MGPVNTLNSAVIEEWFFYHARTGKLFWKKKPNRRIRIGDEAGTVTNHNYYQVTLHHKRYLVHNLIWIMHYGPIPQGFEPDHIDHNGLNNLIDNLRLVTHIKNLHNKSMQVNNSSGVNGVSYSTSHKKWRARIQVRGKEIFLGYFDSEKDGFDARKDAESKYKFHQNHGKKREKCGHNYCRT